MRAKVPWVLLEQCFLEEEYTPQATAKGRGTSGGRQTGIQFQYNLPEKLPTKSAVYTEIVHIPGCLLTWACCIGPLSIHFTRFSLESLSFIFSAPFMGNNPVSCPEWMPPKPSVDVGKKTSGLEKNLYNSLELQKTF